LDFIEESEASLSWKSITTIEEVCPNINIDETELFDEVMILKKAITEKEEIKAKSTGEIWYEFVQQSWSKLINKYEEDC
jgi:hypothetical protein